MQRFICIKSPGRFWLKQNHWWAVWTSCICAKKISYKQAIFYAQTLSLSPISMRSQSLMCEMETKQMKS
jgi:hypothetical protein